MSKRTNANNKPEKILEIMAVRIEKRMNQIFALIQQSPNNFELDDVFIKYANNFIDVNDQLEMYR